VAYNVFYALRRMGCIGKLMVNRLEEPGFVEEVRRTLPHGEGVLRLRQEVR
jgi:hypothetical protein